MIAPRVSTDDIRSMGSNGTLTVTLPNYKACLSAKNMVNYTRYMYPRKDGQIYTMHIDKETFTVTIRTLTAEQLKAERKTKRSNE